METKPNTRKIVASVTHARSSAAGSLHVIAEANGDYSVWLQQVTSGMDPQITWDLIEATGSLTVAMAIVSDIVVQNLTSEG